MGFRSIQNVSIAVGRSVSQILLRQFRSNFETHEARLSDIETNKTTVPTGLIFEFAGEVPPTGFLLCDGSEISRSDFASLFAIVGVSFGTPSNGSVFKLPNSLGRVFVGSGDTFSLGDADGSETHTLITAELPVHSHTVSEPGHTHLGAHITPAGSESFFHRQAPISTIQVSPFYGSLTTNSQTTGITLSNTGGGAAHNNLQPSLVTNYVIKT